MSKSALAHGIRFGLLLQLAVGPVCLFVLRTGSEHGIGQGLIAVVGVAFVDALYIALAVLGVTRWADGTRIRRTLQYAGAAIIALFGLDIMANAAGLQLLPALSVAGSAVTGAGTFLSALLLTSSNPLTILFWAGVFSAKVVAERYGRSELWFFSLGCVGATVAFLSAIVLAGVLLGRALPDRALVGLNVAVGLALLYYAARLGLRRQQQDHGSVERRG
jgi:threonine/homoserine/homoserine lactone efflux protein